MSTNGMVVAAHPLSVQAGLDILKQGGNAVDAAVAVAAANTVVISDMISPAGSGYAVVYDAKRHEVKVCDFNGEAPAAANPKDFTPQDKMRGFKAATVPGNLAGWDALLKRFGTMSFAQVLAPAINLAEKGVPVDVDTSFHINRYIPELSIYPTWVNVFLKDGKGPKPGELLRMPDLARTYRRVAAEGADVFYRGDIAKEFARFFKENGGLITEDDLANYKVQWKDPIKTTYRGYEVYGAPPTSSAITWMETLKILDGYDLKAMGHNSPEYLQTHIEAVKRAYVDGYKYVGDPNFVQVPVAMMLSEAHAADLRKTIDPNKASVPTIYQVSSTIGGPDEYRGCTTHMIIVDRWGNAVSMTNTIGTFYGAGFVAGNTGVLFSNGMDWFDLDKSIWTGTRSATAMEPQKRNRWTLAPGLMLKDGKLAMVVGGAGAEMTMQGVSQVVCNVLDFGMDAQKAIDAPRFRWGDIYHYTGGTQLRLEAGIGADVRAKLATKGHDIVPLSLEPKPGVGTIQVLVVHPDSFAYMGGGESRSRGYVGGW